MKWMDEIKVVIFDLDGTLYQDDTFLGRYIAHMLKDNFNEEEIAAAVHEAYDILEGNHPVHFGCYFDRIQHDVFLHENFIPTSCYSWEGMKRERHVEDDSSLLFIGDVWGIAHLYAAKFSISQEKRIEAFEKVRYEMIEKPYAFQRHDRLFESIKSLHAEKKIFMTNTAGETGPAFVSYLNIGSLFNEYIFDAKKPVGMDRIVKRFVKKGYKPSEILSIGDNPFNDLLPVKRLGGRTCLISPYKHYGQYEWDVTVQTVEELSDVLMHMSAVKL